MERSYYSFVDESIEDKLLTIYKKLLDIEDLLLEKPEDINVETIE